MLGGHRDLAYQSHADALELTAGTFSPRQTRGAFARAGGAQGRRKGLTDRQKGNRGLGGSIPALPINVQSGRLHRAMRVAVARGRGLQSFDVGPQGAGRSNFVLLVGGTRYMVSRGYFAEIRRRWRPRNKAFYDHFIKSQT